MPRNFPDLTSSEIALLLLLANFFKSGPTFTAQIRIRFLGGGIRMCLQDQNLKNSPRPRYSLRKSLLVRFFARRTILNLFLGVGPLPGKSNGIDFMWNISIFRFCPKIIGNRSGNPGVFSTVFCAFCGFKTFTKHS